MSSQSASSRARGWLERQKAVLQFLFGITSTPAPTCIAGVSLPSASHVTSITTGTGGNRAQRISEGSERSRWASAHRAERDAKLKRLTSRPYHNHNKDEREQAVRAAARVMLHSIYEHVPVGHNRARAIDKINEALMLAVYTIDFDGEHLPR